MAFDKHADIHKKLSWVCKPTLGHLVHFYKSEDDLFAPLTEYISSGLLLSNTCIVIATAAHLKKLDGRLHREGVDVTAARANGLYITLDAKQTLEKFMVDDLPDHQRFIDVVGSLLMRSAAQGRPIRAYGEMVALLWRENNKNGVVQLEALWNELAETQPFSLFCAYPELHFIMNHNVIEEIRDYHNVNLALL